MVNRASSRAALKGSLTCQMVEVATRTRYSLFTRYTLVRVDDVMCFASDLPVVSWLLIQIYLGIGRHLKYAIITPDL